MKYSPATVSKTHKRPAEKGDVDDRSRSARPKISNTHQDRALAITCLKDGRKTSVDVTKCRKVTKKKPLLTDQHQKVCLERTKDWTVADVNKVVWSDDKWEGLHKEEKRGGVSSIMCPPNCQTWEQVSDNVGVYIPRTMARAGWPR